MINLQSERRFRALIEKSRDAVLLISAGGNIIYANPSAGESLGCTPEAVMAMSLWDLTHPNDSSFIEKNLLQGENAADIPLELRLQHYNGSWLWFECTLTNLIHDPAVEGIILNLRDITDRKEAHHALQSQRDLLLNLVAVFQAANESAELDKMLYNLIKIGKWLTLANSGSVFLFDQYGALVYTTSFHGRLDSSRVQRLLNEGLSGWVIKNNQAAIVMDTETDERWLELPAENYKPRSALAIPIQGDHAIQAILVLTHARPNHFNNDHLKTLKAAGDHIAATLRNARLYNQAKANLADQSALIESSQDGFVLVNLHGQTRVINSAAMKLTGINEDPAVWINRSAVDLLKRARHTCPELVKTMIAEFKHALVGSEETATGEVEMLPRTLEWIHLPIIVNEKILGRLLILRDVTERRKLEQQREELTAMIVHDLRNPTSAISGIVSMLKSLKKLDEIPDDYDLMMQLAERNVTKLLDLIQEILDVSQLENGQLPVNKKPFPIEQLIKETLQLQRPIITMKEMNLEANIQPDLPPVLADERLIRRVLQNLVDNAAQFSRRNSSIYVSAKLSAENANWIQISVQDYGIGIPAELQNRVFEKFVTNRQIEPGSGLGLTFCRLAILAHNGRIWAESEENNGSTFHFTLPVCEAFTLPVSPA